MMKMSEARQVLMRGLRLKCPACGRAPLYESAFRMRRFCPACGLVFEREQGYYVGAIYLNVMITEAIIISVYLISIFALSEIGDAIYFIMIGLAVTLPLIIFRFARSLWLSLDHIISPRRDHTDLRRTRTH